MNLLLLDRGPISSTDGDVAAWITAVRGAGGTVTAARAKLLTAWAAAGKTNGWWAKLDRIWVRAGENSTQALIDFIARSTSTLPVAPAFTANLGYTGNGSTQYINTGYNPGTNGVNYTQNSACFGAWVQTNDSRTSGSPAYIGSSSASDTFVRSSATQTGWAINVTSGVATTVSPTTGIGLAYFERSASNLSTFYQNGVSQGTQAGASIGVGSHPFYELAVNNGSDTAVQFNNGVVSLSFMGGAMGATIELAFYNDTHTMMTGISGTNFP